MTVTVWTKTPCRQCTAVKRWLEREGVAFEARALEDSPDDMRRLVAAGFESVPIIEAPGHEAFAGFDPARLAAVRDSVEGRG